MLCGGKKARQVEMTEMRESIKKGATYAGSLRTGGSATEALRMAAVMRQKRGAGNDSELRSHRPLEGQHYFADGALGFDTASRLLFPDHEPVRGEDLKADIT